MNKKRTIDLFATAWLVLFGTAIVACSQERVEPNKFQGTWKVVSARSRIPDVEKRFLIQIWKFDVASILIYAEEEKEDRLVGQMAISLDPTKKPAHIDLFGYLNGKKATIPLLGIYNFEKDNKLKLSWSGHDGRDRPTSFDLDPNDQKAKQFSLVLQKIPINK